MLGWALLLTVAGLVVAGVSAYALQSAQVDERVDANLAQEVAEFRELAEGEDPSTGESWTSLRELMLESLRRQVPDTNETLLALVDGRVAFVPPDPRPIALERDPAAVEELAGTLAAGYGELTSDGERVRYAAVPVRVAGDDARGVFVAAYLADRERAELVALLRTYAFAAAVTLLLVAAVGWVAAGRLLRPISLLREASQRIGENDLSQRIPVGEGDDDLTELARTYNAMLDRLQDAFAAQRRFLDDAGHELRTPVTIVRGHLELMDEEDPGDVRETRALVIDELDRMARLVDDLSTLAKSERPDFLHLDEVEVGSLTDDVLDKVRGLGERDWTLDGRGEALVRADPQRLTQALVQLAANAVAHSEPGSQIGLGSSVDGRVLRFWVRDTGTGIPADELPRIFERFHRGDGHDRAEGSGLGLAIVQAIAEAHGGRVVVVSAPGAGATFTLELPLVSVRTVPAATRRLEVRA
ncbi:MAG TPA: ATP-binding protein [Jiangellales bacterium]|nr:ATP-binding protein [Jiangellales bacterium]